jgi:hypothetical protein
MMMRRRRREEKGGGGRRTLLQRHMFNSFKWVVIIQNKGKFTYPFITFKSGN